MAANPTDDMRMGAMNAGAGPNAPLGTNLGDCKSNRQSTKGSRIPLMLTTLFMYSILVFFNGGLFYLHMVKIGGYIGLGLSGLLMLALLSLLFYFCLVKCEIGESCIRDNSENSSTNNDQRGSEPVLVQLSTTMEQLNKTREQIAEGVNKIVAILQRFEATNNDSAPPPRNRG